jgi:formamidopyrimidine-DNA glycosylase
MPELPEVETVRRGLEQLIVGRKILAVKVLNDKSFQASAGDTKQFVVGAKVSSVRRRAKMLLINLSSDYTLVTHLKMTGQMVFRGEENWGAGHPSDSFLAELPDRSTRVEFDLDGDAKLFFNDQRKFGWMKLMPTATVGEANFIKKLGPEIADFSGDLTDTFDEQVMLAEFIERARRHQNSTIKATILNQEVVAGIGNIYADESLWAAKIHPLTRVKDLSNKQLQNILAAAVEAMETSLSVGGSSSRNYIKADGTRGDYLEKFAKVFNRAGQPCPRCGTEIVKLKVAGRGTHICPKCQKVKSK